MSAMASKPPGPKPIKLKGRTDCVADAFVGSGDDTYLGLCHNGRLFFLLSAIK